MQGPRDACQGKLPPSPPQPGINAAEGHRGHKICLLLRFTGRKIRCLQISLSADFPVKKTGAVFPVHRHPRNSQTSALCLHLLPVQLRTLLKQPSIKQTNKKAIVRPRRADVSYQTALHEGINLFLGAACRLAACWCQCTIKPVVTR